MIREAARYLVVQVAAYGIDLCVYLAAMPLGASPLLANVGGKLAAGGAAFVAHRFFTFRARAEPAAGQGFRYALLLAANLPISSVALYLLLKMSPPTVAKIAADVVCVGITFALSRSIVFARHRELK